VRKEGKVPAAALDQRTLATGGSNRSPFGEGRQDGLLQTTPSATSRHDGRVVALLVLVPAVGASAASATRQVQVLDDCDPATFNAAIGPGTCIKDGETTFSEFTAQLLAQVLAPA